MPFAAHVLPKEGCFGLYACTIKVLMYAHHGTNLGPRKFACVCICVCKESLGTRTWAACTRPWKMHHRIMDTRFFSFFSFDSSVYPCVMCACACVCCMFECMSLCPKVRNTYAHPCSCTNIRVCIETCILWTILGRKLGLS